MSDLYLLISLSLPLLPSLAGITYTRWTRTLPTVTRSFSVRWVRCLPSVRTRCSRRAVIDKVTLITRLWACVLRAHVIVYMCLPVALLTRSPVGACRARRADPVKKIIQSISSPNACVILAHRRDGRKVWAEAERTGEEVRAAEEEEEGGRWEGRKGRRVTWDESQKGEKDKMDPLVYFQVILKGLLYLHRPSDVITHSPSHSNHSSLASLAP